MPICFVVVDVSQAGIGKLVVIISVDGVNVPNSVHQDGPHQYRFAFKPTIAKPHDITVSVSHLPPPTCLSKIGVSVWGQRVCAWVIMRLGS